MTHGKFRFSVDRGGTFTDVYAEIPGEEGFRVVKLLSEDPGNYPDAPREGIRRILESVTGKQFPKERFSSDGIEWIRMGTTVATNALLERKGARIALFTTRGFGDLLGIGNQSRPGIFDLVIRKPELLYERVVEVDERVRLLKPGEAPEGRRVITGTTGEKLLVLTPPDEDALRKRLKEVFDAGIRSIAVVLMHAYTFGDHEALIGRLAEETGFTRISLSHRVMPMVKMTARGDTTTVDAYLTPHIRRYLDGFREGFTDLLSDTGLLFMQSDGGLVSADGFKGSNAILSGPAGGVVGYAAGTFHQAGGKPVIGFDMGGTSTDVSRYGGAFELVHETETAGVRIQAPQMHIKTVAAGGGSRLFFLNGMLQVGPESAGAHPGPVCYRKGGELAVTDANLYLGRIQPEYFPKIFGKGEDLPLDLSAAKAAFETLAAEINREYGKKGIPPLAPEAVALGFLEVANEVMVRPIREISVMRGYDIKNHVLACFGGAGGQHACAVARDLGIRKIFIHRFAGILSAYGMGLARIVVEKQEPSAAIYREKSLPSLLARLSRLETAAREELRGQGYGDERIETVSYLNLRYKGTDTAMMIPSPGDGDFEGAFRRTYMREFGFDLSGRKILVDDIRVRASAGSAGIRRVPLPEKEIPPEPAETVRCWFHRGWRDTPLFLMEKLGAGQSIEGPAIIMQDTATILVEPDCKASITGFGDVSIELFERDAVKLHTEVDPIQLSIFGNLFISIAEQMGRTLQKTAVSTNIKERLDFSCAVFDQKGGLVANAPHIPVHLGAMGEAVKQQILLLEGNLKEGDVLVTNHPAAGGSHLPDITVISPVFRNGRPVFFVASRGHHAEIGGISPGSMPPFSRSLWEEGVCIKSFKLVENGVFNEEGISELLLAPGKIGGTGGAPSISGTRNLADNISDLKAQVAANRRGIDLLLEMIDCHTEAVVTAYMGHIQDTSEAAVRKMLGAISRSRGLAEVDRIRAVDYLDDGSPIRLTLTVDRRDGSAIFDFTGSGRELWGNLNTPRAVTASAVVYALRSLIDRDLPLNQGFLNPITLVLEEGSLLSPSEDAAVVGGNVLTSQRITDVILKAFHAAAASQGCMNNFTFGSDTFGYYETIGGGAGAGPTWHGQSGVHTHMTNTRITDPEVLERRFPVMLKSFSLRRGSGGRGRFRGGDGLIREFEFLEDLNVAILSERRVHAPFGLGGGFPGKRGENIFTFRDGRTVNLGGKNEIRARRGDSLRIMTPGGGGFGGETK